jgi:hypothetical protein
LIEEKTMFSVRWRRALPLATVVACALLLSAAPIPGQPQDAPRRLPVAELEKLHRLIKPRPGESRWMEIDWYPSVWEARQRAAREGKPLFLWAGSGGAPPAGC